MCFSSLLQKRNPHVSRNKNLFGTRACDDTEIVDETHMRYAYEWINTSK